MARFHFWGFIVNEAGEPIEYADVTIKLATTDTLACLYFDEYSSYNTCDDINLPPTGPQLKTLINGYYEFWIGDITESKGYRNDQKFKIEWERPGVAYGKIDNVNILPMTSQTYPLSLSDCTSGGPLSTDMNKLISDELGCRWENHTRFIVENDIVHGIEFVDVNQFDTKPNKLISNEYGWRWDHHVNSTTSSYNPSAGAPHDIHPIDILSSDNIRNKVVSNKDIHDLYVLMLKSYEERIFNNLWVYSGHENIWHYNIHHNLGVYYPHVTCYNNTTHEIEKTSIVTYLDQNNVRISINTENPGNRPEISLWVRVSG